MTRVAPEQAAQVAASLALAQSAAGGLDANTASTLPSSVSSGNLKRQPTMSNTNSARPSVAAAAGRHSVASAGSDTSSLGFDKAEMKKAAQVRRRGRSDSGR
ncbi:uncharacterized protein EV422DRAFT_556644 [Fimicolochytrium jonesii]|uniref:uncharacterized protein n=1 Tax=Fimicolochytrium jonesii TaxID=1396493 RepID=UPI0022FEC590|nr:uncharacterized protein EV422DRAFT_556644 [Fimicolochytrium jonesii]KAI8821867.1 hypothetical protein EV422DRAFT_556644 [Fimicolochytrium jonesii]